MRELVIEKRYLHLPGQAGGVSEGKPAGGG